MTAKIQILSNTNYALAEVIKSELLESAKVNIAVAFLKKTGIDHISKALDYALMNSTLVTSKEMRTSFWTEFHKNFKI